MDINEDLNEIGSEESIVESNCDDCNLKLNVSHLTLELKDIVPDFVLDIPFGAILKVNLHDGTSLDFDMEDLFRRLFIRL